MAEAHVDKVKKPSEARALAALPLSIARSELFSVAPKGVPSEERVLATARRGVNASITYTGPHLNMEHFKAWQALLYLADECGQLGGEQFSVPIAKVLKFMGKSYRHNELKTKLFSLLQDLRRAEVNITSNSVKFDSSGLIDFASMDLETRTISTRIGHAIATGLLEREILRNDVERSRSLGRHYFAIWLHGFISSQASRSDKQVSRHTFHVDEIRRLCGSKAKERTHFVQDLSRALDKLKTGENPLIKDWDWCDVAKRKVWVDKAHTLVKVIGESAGVAKMKRNDDAAQAARSRKARVQL